jgi:DNA mismatch repair protein MutS
VPNDVIKRARAYLRELEAQQSRAQGALQQGFDFSVEEPADADPIRDAVDALNPDSMTPREALDALYELKKLNDE